LEQPLFPCSIFLHCLVLGSSREGLYICVFRSIWVSGDKDGRQRRLEAPTSMGGTAWQGARTTSACSPLGLISLTSSPPGDSHDKILMLQKSHVNLSSGRFLTLKNTQNRVFLFYRVITKIRGIDGKST
jgi:hypothetical protein